MFMEISMKETGKKIKHMALESTHTVMVQLMKVNGSMICNMEKEWNIGTITQNILVNIRKEKNME